MRSWKEIPEAGLIIEPGSSKHYKTGDWRSLKPVFDKKKCTHCMICPPDCPEDCIPVVIKDGQPERQETDFNFCKGCGICEKVCPFKAIKMIEEREVK